MPWAMPARPRHPGVIGDMPDPVAAAVDVGHLTEVAEDVYAYLQPNGGWCLNNAGIIVVPDGLLVIDTAATETRAKRLRAAAGELHAGPVRAVINTHHHGDHTFGNHIVSDGGVIIAHDLARAEMARTGLALTTLWPDVDWGDVRVSLPTVTFSSEMTLHAGPRRVQLIHVGPAHTTNDIVVWVPGDRLLFAGDVVMSGCTPFNLMGSVRGALGALTRLRSLSPATVVCGHGDVRGPEVLDAVAAYLRLIEDLAVGGRAAGQSPLETARQADLSEFGHLVDPERIVGNLHRAYAELAGGELGEPLDVVSVFSEMTAYNGGRLPVCLA